MNKNCADSRSIPFQIYWVLNGIRFEADDKRTNSSFLWAGVQQLEVPNSFVGTMILDIVYNATKETALSML